MIYHYRKLTFVHKQPFRIFLSFFIFIALFIIIPFSVYADTYVSGESLYPNCNPPNINCGFTVNPNSVIVYIGDSWTAGNHVVLQLNNDIVSKYPFAGAGYVPVDSYPYNIVLNDATKTSTGTWTDSSAARGLGPNIMHTNSSDIATPATKGVTCTGTDFTIYYLKQSGGGSFTYSIDSGGNTTISTANASNALGTTNITGQTQAQHTILMTVSAAGTAGVTLFGVDCNITNSGGIKIDKLGMSGSRAPKWTAIDAILWQSEIAALNPSLVIITLGQNDVSASETADTYISNITTIINRVRIASPTVPIILAPQSPYTTVTPIGDVSAYYPSLQDLARTNGYGYVEPAKFFGSYTEASTNGLWAADNPGHLSTSGDQLFASILMDYLGLAAAPTVTSITGNNPQNITGGKSITINGTNFIDLLTATGGKTAATVTIGGVAATNVVFASANKLTVTAPANARGTADVVVTNYTQSATCHNCITYNTNFSSSISAPNGYTKDNTKPTLIFKKTSVSGGTISSYSVSLDSGKNRSFTTSGIPANGNGSANYVWRDDSSVKVTFTNENDSDSSNDEIQVYFKGLDSTELTEGKHTWTVTAYDNLSTSDSESADFYIDKSLPSISELAIANVSTISPGSDYNLDSTNRTPSFSGLATDSYKGSIVTNNDGSKDTFDKATSGPQTMTLTFKKIRDDKTFTDYSIKDYSLSDIQDKNGDNKSTRFYITTPFPLVDGYYRVSIALKDGAGNTYNQPDFYISLNAGTTNPRQQLFMNNLETKVTKQETIPAVTQKEKQQFQENGYTVKIKVVDKQNKPVTGAKVTIHSKVQETITNKEGIAEFNNVEHGEHEILIAYNNFQGEQSLNLTGEAKSFDLQITIHQKGEIPVMLTYKIIAIMGLVIILLISLLIKAKRKETK